MPEANKSAVVAHHWMARLADTRAFFVPYEREHG
jgi:hypothetical protein